MGAQDLVAPSRARGAGSARGLVRDAVVKDANGSDAWRVHVVVKVSGSESIRTSDDGDDTRWSDGGVKAGGTGSDTKGDSGRRGGVQLLMDRG